MYLHVADLIPRKRGMHFRKLRVQPWKIISVVKQHMLREYKRGTYTQSRRCFILIHDSYTHPKLPIAHDKTVYNVEPGNAADAIPKIRDRRKKLNNRNERAK